MSEDVRYGENEQNLLAEKYERDMKWYAEELKHVGLDKHPMGDVFMNFLKGVYENVDSRKEGILSALSTINDLMTRTPLTELTDTEDDWEYKPDPLSGEIQMVHKRYPYVVKRYGKTYHNKAIGYTTKDGGIAYYYGRNAGPDGRNSMQPIDLPAKPTTEVVEVGANNNPIRE